MDDTSLRAFHAHDSGAPTLTVIFVHGLKGDPMDTWRSGDPPALRGPCTGGSIFGNKTAAAALRRAYDAHRDGCRAAAKNGRACACCAAARGTTPPAGPARPTATTTTGATPGSTAAFGLP